MTAHTVSPSPRRLSRRLLGALALLALSLSALGCGEQETFEGPTGPGPWVLVDLYHTRIQNPEDYRLQKDGYSYQGVFGYARAFDHLQEHGYNWNSIRELELSEARLQGYDVLFINLVHDERPDFTDAEVEAIQAYVRGGGGLVVIADHTNVYYHAQRINRFLREMGVEVTYHSALESGDQSVAGLGWIAIEEMADHPINAGVDMISFQTGGTMAEPSAEGAVATSRLSETGWGDFWDESQTHGFYGNWERDEGEPQGDNPVVVASEYGQGRVVVVGDQNIYGDAWLHFGDNFAHFMNIFEWAAGREGAPEPLRTIKPKGLNVGVDIRLSERAAGSGGSQGYYTWFVNFNRDQEVTGRGITRLDNRDDALVLPTLRQEPGPEDLEAIVGYLEAGKKVVVTFELDDLSDARYGGTLELLHHLAPDLEVELGEGGEVVDFGQSRAQLAAALSMNPVPELDGRSALRSEAMDVSGIELASMRGEGEQRQAYLLDVHTQWGEPLVETEGGVDIMRRKRLGEGELIVVLQDGFWRGRTLGSSESEPPPEDGVAGVELQYRLLDYLKQPLEPCAGSCPALPDLDPEDPPVGDEPRVLVDLYHTRKQNPVDYRLIKDVYRYQGNHGYARAFDHLTRQGYVWDTIRDEPLSEDNLAGYDVLFINLVHDERPDFTDAEVELIKDFVRDGGGLLVVGDHSNVYYHAQRINRFLHEMGLGMTYHTAVDRGEAQVTGLGWIAITDLADHPVNAELDLISFQTGGTMEKLHDGATVTARLSERGLADYWDEESGIGFYGNWRFDGDEELEPRGRLPVGMAAEYGQGRVVLVGDQNMFGDTWLHFGGNFDYWLNSIEWLAGQNAPEEPLRQTRPKGTHIGIDIAFNDYSPGSASDENYYTWFVNFNRDQTVTAEGITRLTNDEDVLLLPTPKRPFEASDVEDVREYLRAGKQVVVLFEIDRVAQREDTRHTLALLQELAPDFQVTDTDGAQIPFDQPLEDLVAKLEAANFDRVPGTTALSSPDMEVDDLYVGSYTGREDSDVAYYLDLTSSWGRPLLEGAGGASIARIKEVDGGELIVFVQDGFWRVRSLGNSENKRYPTGRSDLVELQYRFIEYLEQQVRP